MMKKSIILFMLATAFTFAYGQDKPQTDNRAYVKVEVDGLACPFCAYGLEKKLKNIEGQKDVSIDIDKGYATFNVPANRKTSKEKLNKIVEEAGFTARKVTFSEDPFEKTKPGEE